jgi:outer membrane protein OmpA-like peptidoglycan-associated protein
MELTLGKNLNGMRCILSLSCLIIGLPLWVSGQPFGSGEFKTKFMKADAMIYDGRHEQALPLVMDLIATDSSNANLSFMLGSCYLFTKQYSKALYYLDKAVRDVSISHQEANPKERKAPGMAYFYLGKAHHFINEFDQAISNLYNYRSFIDMNDYAAYTEVKRHIEYSENAKELVENPVKTDIKNIGPTLNTNYPEFSPVISADGQTLIFTSRREGSTGGKLDQNGKFYEDIYVSKREGEDWSKPQSIGRNINTDGHEASIGLSPDGQTLFIYKDDNGDGNIYESSLINNEWSTPRKVGGDVNTKSWETHATISARGDMIVFTSNRDGGQGKRDIWFCKLLPNGQWGVAQNMGPLINTLYDEDAPSLSADGNTLVFSSQGHNSMGGFDIFRTEFVDGAWTAPENLGYPINTAEDDIFMVTTPDGRYAYYSSQREGGAGETDLYRVKLDVKRPSLLTVFRGLVIVPNMDFAGTKVVMDVQDQASGLSMGQFRPNATTGAYVLILEPGMSYRVTYSASGYGPVQKTIMSDDMSAYEEIMKAVDLEPVVFGGELEAQLKMKQDLERERAANERLLAEENARLQAAFEAAQAQAKAKEEEEARIKADEQASAEALAAEEARKAEEALRATEAKQQQEQAAETEQPQQTEPQPEIQPEPIAEQPVAVAPQENDALAKKRAAIEEMRKRMAQQAEDNAHNEPTEVTTKEITPTEQPEPQKSEPVAAEEPVVVQEAAAEPEKQPEKQPESAVVSEPVEQPEPESTQVSQQEEARVTEPVMEQQPEEVAVAEPVQNQKSDAERQLEEKRIKLQRQIDDLRQKQLGKSQELQNAADEAARLKAESDAKAREVEEAKAKAAEAERQRLAIEAETKKEAEAIAKAEREAQEIVKLEQKAHAEAEAKRLADEKAREEAEARKIAEEEARIKAEMEAQRKAEEAARKKAEAEEKARIERERMEQVLAEQRIKKEEEEKRKAVLAEERKKAEAERQETIRIEKEQARIKAEAAKAEAEAEAIARRNSAIEAGTIAELRKINQKLIDENRDIKKQLADINAKLDMIINILSAGKGDETFSEADLTELSKKGKLVLNNIFFDYNQASLRPESKKELNKLVSFLKGNPDVAIVIGGHTDSRGNDEYNMNLSQERSESVSSYLVSSGIDASRLSARGYGESKPIARNENVDGTDNPKGRQLNRRIEISIVGAGMDDVEVKKIKVPSELKVVD